MSSPKRQHFIPRSYLKNFATIDGDKEFVDAMNPQTKEIKTHLSTKDICVVKNLYTFPDVEGEDKYALEKFYAANVDSVYPEVYKLLVDENVTEISEEQRDKILSTALSLYFRSARFLDAKNEELDELIKNLKSADIPENEVVKFQFKGRQYEVLQKELDALSQEIRINNKKDFLAEHLQDWQNFVKHKEYSQITVLKVEGNIPLITCDNPVDIYNPFSAFDVFDPRNSIQLPLDTKYYLWISPNDPQSKRNWIYRGVRNKYFALTSNSSSEKNADDWVIGSEGTLQVHVEELAKHNEETPENIQAVENSKQAAIQMAELLAIAQKKGSLITPEVLSKIEEMKGHPAIKDDAQFKILVAQIDKLSKR